MNERVNTFALQLSPDTDREPKWLKLIPVGTFLTRDGRGPFLAERSALQAIVDRSLAYAGATDIMIDYDHQSVHAAVPGVGGRAEASGWISKLEVRDDGIYGLVRWTAAAAAKIAAEEYRYLSPFFTSHKTTGEVGKLINAALVNNPAIDLIAASSRFAETEKDVPMNAIAKALGLADNASEAAIIAAITGNQQKIAAAAGLKADAAFDAIVASVAGAVAAVGKIAVAAGLKAEATTDEVVTALSTSASQTVPMTMFNDVKTQLNTLQASIEQRNIDELITGAMLEGKVSPATEPWARNYCKADLAGFKQFLTTAPKLAGTPQLGEDGKVVDPGEMDANALAASARAYQDEQSKLGNSITFSAAVVHVRDTPKK